MNLSAPSPMLVDDKGQLANSALRTPRAAGIAGIVFSLLLICSLWLLRVSMPADPLEAGEWPATSSATVSIALNLVPVAGVAFMWFLGVLRDRLGAKEDKFFATVFLGSGLMFLGMIFIYPAAGGGLILTYSAVPRALRDGATFAFARTFTYEVMHVYAFKMAAVFMVTTSTLKGDGALDRIRLRRSDTPADWQQLSGLGSVCLSLLGIPGEP